LGLYANLPPTSHGTPTINKLLLSSLSKGTWAGRTRVAKAFTARGTKDPLHSLDRLLEDRLASVAPITVTRDIGHLKWLLPRLLPSAQADPMVNLLQDIQRGVRKMDAGRPLTKALPLSRQALTGFLALNCLVLRAMILIAFRTASRIQDLMYLRRRDLKPTPEGLMISFCLTKTNQEGESRADHRIIIPNPPPDIMLYAQRIPSHQFLFTPLHKQHLSTQLRAHRPTAHELNHWRALDPQNHLRSHYTLHSAKRGAAALAWQGVVDKKITLQDLMLLLKHKDVSSALEYCPCPVLAARAAGSTAASLTA
jgi:hypothetical protein